MKNYSKLLYFSNRIDGSVKTENEIGLKERYKDFRSVHVKFDMLFDIQVEIPSCS